MTLIERQNLSRRSDSSLEFPLMDSEGVFVTRNRRCLPDRRREKYDLADLDEKVYYLKTAVYHSPLQFALTKHDSMVLSRVLAEISIGELTFLLDHHGAKNIFDSTKLEDINNAELFHSYEERTIGLMNLGLLTRNATDGTGRGHGAYHFTPLADRLVKLFTRQNN